MGARWHKILEEEAAVLKGAGGREGNERQSQRSGGGLLTSVESKCNDPAAISTPVMRSMAAATPGPDAYTTSNTTYLHIAKITPLTLVWL